jgi:hypothetical protein
VLLSVVPRHPAAPSAIKHTDATTTTAAILETFIVVLIILYQCAKKSCLIGSL